MTQTSYFNYQIRGHCSLRHYYSSLEELTLKMPCHILGLYWTLQNLKTGLNTGNPQLWGPCPMGCLHSLSSSRLHKGDTRKCKETFAALPSTLPLKARVFLNPQMFDKRKFISLTSAKGTVEKVTPILQCIAKNSLVLSSNPVQLPKGYCRLAQHIRFGLPTSRRQRVVTHQMLSTLQFQWAWPESWTMLEVTPKSSSFTEALSSPLTRLQGKNSNLGGFKRDIPVYLFLRTVWKYPIWL